MPKNKLQKEDVIKSYQDKLSQYKTVYLVKSEGITANEAVTLKKTLAGLDSKFNIVKNSLFKIALERESLPEVTVFEDGQHAVIFTGDSSSEAAKVLNAFIKESTKGEIVGGLYNGKEISAADVISLADLPSKDQLLAQLLSVMNGPMRGFVTVINANTRELVQVMQAIAEKK